MRLQRIQTFVQEPGSQSGGCCYEQALPGFHGTLVEAEAMIFLDKAGACEAEQDLSAAPQQPSALALHTQGCQSLRPGDELHQSLESGEQRLHS